jgi:hypothetical protein
MFQTLEELRASRNGGVPTARAYSTLPPRIPEDATVDYASGPHVAKVYSDYQPGMLNAETGEELLDEDGLPVTQNSRYVIASNHVGEENNNTVFITQSDWTLERQGGAGVTRSQSNVEPKRYLRRAQSAEKTSKQPAPPVVQRSGSSAAAVGGKGKNEGGLFGYKRQGGPKQKAPKSPGVDIIRPGSAKPVNVDKAGQKSASHFIAPPADIMDMPFVESATESQRMKPKRVAPPPPGTPPYSGPSISSSSSHISSIQEEEADGEPIPIPIPITEPLSVPPPPTVPLPPTPSPEPVTMRPKPAGAMANGSSTRYSSHPDDPDALYAIPNRVRNSVLSQGSDPAAIPEERPVIDTEADVVPAPKPISPIAETPKPKTPPPSSIPLPPLPPPSSSIPLPPPPSSPIPVPPPPPPLPAHLAQPPKANQMTVEAVIEPSPAQVPPSPPLSNPTSRRSRGRSVMSADFNERGEQRYLVE